MFHGLVRAARVAWFSCFLFCKGLLTPRSENWLLTCCSRLWLRAALPSPMPKLRFQSEYRAFFFLHEGCHGLLNVSGFTTITTIRLRCIKAPNPGLLQLSSVSVLCINQEDFGGYFARLFCSLSAQSGCCLVSAALGMWRNRKSFGDAKYKAAVEAFQAVPYQTQPPGCCRYHSCSSSLCQRQNRVPLSPDMRQSPHQAAAQGTPWALYCSPWASVQQQ